jgi:hypothetical protein
MALFKPGPRTTPDKYINITKNLRFNVSRLGDFVFGTFFTAWALLTEAVIFGIMIRGITSPFVHTEFTPKFIWAGLCFVAMVRTVPRLLNPGTFFLEEDRDEPAISSHASLIERTEQRAEQPTQNAQQ